MYSLDTWAELKFMFDFGWTSVVSQHVLGFTVHPPDAPVIEHGNVKSPPGVLSKMGKSSANDYHRVDFHPLVNHHYSYEKNAHTHTHNISEYLIILYINDGVELPWIWCYLAAALGTAPLRRAVSAPADGQEIPAGRDQILKNKHGK